jgi:hypothetical protein
MIDELRALIQFTVHQVPLQALNLAVPAIRERVLTHYRPPLGAGIPTTDG